MGDLKIYDLGEVSVVLCGIPVDSGFGDGECVKIEWDEDDFTTKKGADGEVTRSKTYNGLAKVTLTLMQTASANALFSTLSLLDRTAKNGAGVGPFLLRDRGGATLYAGTKCWIAARPSPTLAREANTREWVFAVADLEGAEMGN
jgi:hypothetical protein